MFPFFRRMKPARKTTRPKVVSWKLHLEVLEDRTVMSVLFPANNGFELPNLLSNTYGNYQYTLGGGGPVTLADQGGSGWTFSGLTGVADNGSDPGGNSFNVVNATNGNADGTMSTFGQAGLIQNDQFFTSFGPSVISQAITFAQGGNVSVNFALEQRGTVGNNPIDVKFDNFDLGTYEALSSTSFNTVTTPSVFLTAGTHTLSFTGTNTQGDDNTQFIDNVQVNVADVDIGVLSAQLQAGNTVQFTYQTTANLGPFQVAAFQSADGTTYNSAQPIATQTITPNPNGGQGSGTFTLPASLPSQDGTEPFIVVVADPNNLIAKSGMDNNVVPLQLPDIVATSLTYDATQGGVDFSYAVTGANLTQNTTAALYWSASSTFDSSDTLAYQTAIQFRRSAPYGPVFVPSGSLATAPSGTTNLLLVVDPNNLISEANKTNNVVSLPNRPMLNAIPNMSVNEGSTLTFAVTATDSNPNATLAFSLDSAPPGATIDPNTGLFSWTPTGGPESAQVTVRVADTSSPILNDTQTFTITVNEVSPTATFVNSGPVVFGTPASVSFSNPFDPSSVATAAGFHYAYALDPSQLATATYANSSPNSSATFSFATAGNYTVYGRIIDEFDGYTQYQTTVTVNKATPAFSLLSSPTAIVGTNSTTLSGQISFGALVPTGNVTITLNGVSQSVAVKPDGTFSILFATRTLRAGAYPISYSYGGDSNFTTATGHGTLNVTYNVTALFDQSQAKQAGSTVSILIQLTNASGANVSSSASAVTALGIASVLSPSVLLPVNAPDNFNFVNGFYFSNGYWEYDLKTSKTLAPGTYSFFFTVAGDPLVHSVQFQIKPECSVEMGTGPLNASVLLQYLLNALQGFNRVIEGHDNDRGDR